MLQPLCNQDQILGDEIPTPYRLDSYQFELPAERIAQQPAAHRDQSRLLALDAATGAMRDLNFTDIVDFLSAGDLLVVNNTRVFPARLLGRKQSGGRVELLLLHYPAEIPAAGAGPELPAEVGAIGLLKGSKAFRPGQKIIFAEDFHAEVVELLADGKARVKLHGREGLAVLLDRYGQLPLPPYIKRQHGEKPEDRQRYQTVFAEETGAIAAPTAGLHFTPELLDVLDKKGVGRASVTLHVGYGTFAPVRARDIRQHAIHSEFLTVSARTAEKINAVRASGGRIWAVGTTTVRALEFAADRSGCVRATEGWCDLYIYPGYRFKVVQNLITNFHLPGSSLLFLVSALAGRERIMAAYSHAVAGGYRFFSYGDAMVISGGVGPGGPEKRTI